MLMRVTVERPLRLRWEVTNETLAVVASARGLARVDPEAIEGILAGLAEHRGLSGSDREALSVELSPLFARFGLTRAQQGAVWDALAVRDDEAPAITDKHGSPLPDPELRDYVNVPLPEGGPLAYEADPTARLRSPYYRAAVQEHVEKEILPYVADAWVDHDKTKIGYEIPLTRHFYVYQTPRPLEEIDAEIKELEKEIQDLLAELTE